MKKSLAFLLSAVLIVTAAIGCGNAKAPQSLSKREGTVTVTDQIGREVTLEAPAEKIVSVYYLSTSLLVLLGASDQLVGIEKKADSRGLYRLASPEILDLEAVGSGKEIDVEKTAALVPDIVIIPKKLKDSVEALEQAGLKVLVVNPETEEEFYSCVTLLGEVSGQTGKAREYLTYCNELREQVEQVLGTVKDRPRVYLSSASSYQSTCTSGMYQTELIERAGGVSVSAGISDSYWKQVSDEQIAAWEPQFWFRTADAEYSREEIEAARGLSGVPAVSGGRLYQIPSEIEPWDYPTSSSILGLVWMAHILHPEAVSQDFYRASVSDFYQRFFEIEIGDEEYGL